MNDTIEVLMVDDNKGDTILVKEAIAKAELPYHMNVVKDGVAAMDYLRRVDAPRLGLIILDLKLPRKTGREVLQEIQADDVLRAIPLIVLSSSRSELEKTQPAGLPDRCFIVKPSTFTGYVQMIQAVEAHRRELHKEEPR
jgi:CheY-like chemotaxis protein